MSFKSIDPTQISVSELHFNLLSAVAPRPICFASTIDSKGKVNLSPYSFFNVFGANPPILIFSPARRVRGNSTKHTLDNVKETGEVVINIVNFPIVEQMSLASTEYEKGVNEFVKAGFTEIPSERIKPPRVKECPVSLECVVNQIIETGTEGGAGNLVICEVVMMHIDEQYLDADGKLDTTKLDLVARMGGSWYCKASGDALFEIPKPIRNKGIGVDALPAHVKNSEILTGNNLGRLGNLELMPSKEEVKAYTESMEYQEIVSSGTILQDAIHQAAKKKIDLGEAKEGLITLLTIDAA